MTKEDEVKTELAPEIIETVLQEGVDFEVTSGKKKRKFIVYPINLGTLFNISKIILTMKEIDANDNKDLFSFGMNNVIDNKYKMLEIVSLGILNKRLSIYDRFKKRRLIKYLDWNLSSKELLRLVQLIVIQMDISRFLACFVSIRRLNLVEAKSKESMSITGKSLAG